MDYILSVFKALVERNHGTMISRRWRPTSHTQWAHRLYPQTHKSGGRESEGNGLDFVFLLHACTANGKTLLKKALSKQSCGAFGTNTFVCKGVSIQKTHVRILITCSTLQTSKGQLETSRQMCT